MKLYVDVDINGNITDVLAGDSVVPTKAFDYFFDVDPSVVENLYMYQVVDDFLVTRDTLPDVGENIQFLTPEKELEQLKKEQIDLVFTLMINGVI